MRRRTLGTLVLLATLSLAGVVFTQVMWLKRAQRMPCSFPLYTAGLEQL